MESPHLLNGSLFGEVIPKSSLKRIRTALFIPRRTSKINLGLRYRRAKIIKTLLQWIKKVCITQELFFCITQKLINFEKNSF
ncbi:hypothetical protein THIOM_003395 [Candidatus Thiomargarita nelsonii]|uniref:Uncharacterized protein n=1 Tax=Candidatus Thiomargarita nelsonii TaxID=1003181 RepID=A0A176RYV7_9GAMM|nr:hypothetical protein THIOM_003395 [Candidatus Thiomargarita nelsonii]